MKHKTSIEEEKRLSISLKIKSYKSLSIERIVHVPLQLNHVMMQGCRLVGQVPTWFIYHAQSLTFCNILSNLDSQSHLQHATAN